MGLNNIAKRGATDFVVAHTASKPGPAPASAVMLAAAVTAGVSSAAVRVPPAAETFPAAVETFRRMPAASHVEASRAPAANSLGRVPAAKQMEATRVR